jgi:YggT family protein
VPANPCGARTIRIAYTSSSVPPLAAASHGTRFHGIKDLSRMIDLASLLLTILNIFTFILIGRALLSWFDPTFHTPIGKILYDLTEPVIAPIRRVVPPMGMFDMSIIVAFILIIVLRELIASAI